MTLPSKRLEDKKITIHKGNLKKVIVLVKVARILEKRQNELAKRFINLTKPECEDYFWDSVYSTFAISKDMRDLFRESKTQ